MKKKLIIFDMDGTLYLGEKLFPHVLEVFNYLKKENIHYVFFTNNSSKSLEFYEKKVQNFGISCNLHDNFYSSTEVTINYLKDRKVHSLFVLGNSFFKEKLAKDFKIIPSYQNDQKVDAVIASFDTELKYDELKDACLYLQTCDALFIATNGDYRCPIEDGLYIPDCGGLIEWIRLCTNKKATIMGKPSPICIYDLMDKFDVTKEETLIVGDRLYTDILVGVNANVETVAVLSGETNKEEINNSSYKPTYILDSVADLPNLLDKAK